MTKSKKKKTTSTPTPAKGKAIGDVPHLTPDESAELKASNEALAEEYGIALGSEEVPRQIEGVLPTGVPQGDGDSSGVSDVPVAEPLDEGPLKSGRPEPLDIVDDQPTAQDVIAVDEPSVTGTASGVIKGRAPMPSDFISVVGVQDILGTKYLVLRLDGEDPDAIAVAVNYARSIRVSNPKLFYAIAQVVPFNAGRS